MKSIVMIGATGAVGTEVVKSLRDRSDISRLSLLGRRAVDGVDDIGWVEQHVVNVLDPAPYDGLLTGHDVAICTLGVGEPSKMSKEEFIAIDKDAVLRFADACKTAGVRHFQLLSSVGVSPESSSFYLRAKGELENGLKALCFDRLSLFHPSMILTPTNRYGLSQAVVLKVWPHLNPVLPGALRKLRGIKVEALGRSIAQNSFTAASGVEVLTWDDMVNP